MSDGLALSWSTEMAERERGNYRLVIGVLLILDAAMALALVLAPAGAIRLLAVGDPASAAWARIAGLLALIVVAMLWTGRRHPNRAKLVNVIGIVTRFLFGVALILIGGRLLWLGLFEAVAALVMFRFYYRFFAALVMARP